MSDNQYFHKFHFALSWRNKGCNNCSYDISQPKTKQQTAVSVVSALYVGFGCSLLQLSIETSID